MIEDLKIGFKNIKRFRNFPLLGLSPITIIVGANNSGKSSYIAALTFLLENLKKQPKLDRFLCEMISSVSFREQSYTHFGWGDFTKFINKDGDGVVTYSISNDDTTVKFSFGATKEKLNENPSLSLSLPIESVEITYLGLGLKCIGQRDTNGIWSFEYYCRKDIFIKWLNSIILLFDEYENYWRNNESYPKNENNEELSCTISWIEKTFFTFSKSQKKAIRECPSVEEFDNCAKQLLQAQLNLFINFKHNIEQTLEQLNLNENENIEYEWLTKQGNNETVSHLLDLYFELNSSRLSKESGEAMPQIFTNSFYLSYIESHVATHDTTLLVKDKNNYLAQTIADFMAVKDSSNSEVHKWICKWLKKFEICEDFKIQSHYYNELYTVDISRYSSHNEDEITPLSFLGTGAIQLFTLLIKIATFIPQYIIADSLNQVHTSNKNETDYWEHIATEININLSSMMYIFVEEPEMNLHPRLQSMLSDLFYEVYILSKGNLTFVVETHSEYLIRRTQVLVAEAHYKVEEELELHNPFKVYYFPENGIPYDMGYRIDGFFSESFGSGFFDVASNLTFKLY